MSDVSQETRPLQIYINGVADNAVLITSLSGVESISQLYRFTCGLAVPVDTPVTFPMLLGKMAVVAIKQTATDWRFIQGIIHRLTEGPRGERFAEYTAEIVPPLWMMTRSRRSRIFQHQTTEDILRAVIGGLYPLGQTFQLEGTYQPRNVCAQYHESDFAFLSRLIEEEGWYYYFTHSAEAHGIVISDNPRGHAAVPGVSTFQYSNVTGAAGFEGRVLKWAKAQSLRTGSFTFTDHTFEMPSNTLEAVGKLPASVSAGTVSHSTEWTQMADHPVVDHPGGYARWRDGIDAGGGEKAADLQHVFEDNVRIANVRAQQEMTAAVEVTAASSYGRVTPGHTFTLAGHPDGDGDYLITAATHHAGCGATWNSGDGFDYGNTFTCIPIGVVYRTPIRTPRPVIRGTQTGVVVGAEGAEIDVDKYGRVKVWLRWDPAGERGLDTSCWMRVAQFWAGKAWGSAFWPRVGDEVVVSFLDGDPDRPLVIGSVYNADNMPIYTLPDDKAKSGIKTHSTTEGTTETYNELRFEDTKGAELVHIQAERNMSVVVEVDRTTTVGNNSTVTIGTDKNADPHANGKSTATVFGDTKLVVTKGDFQQDVQTGKAVYHVKGTVAETFDDTLTTTTKNDVALVSQDGTISIQASSGKLIGSAKQAVELKSSTDAVNVTATTQVKLAVGAASITMKSDGTIQIQGVNITISGTKIDVAGAAMTSIKGAMVKINC